MAAPSVNNPQSALTLTAQENEEINDKARWLHRVVNPFVDFYIIMAVGAAGSPTATGAARGREDRQTRDHAKDLTPVQRKVYTEDFEEITGHLPFIKTHLESDVATKAIRKVVNRVQSTASQGRQSDTKTLKQAIITLIPEHYLPRSEDGTTAVNMYKLINVKNPGAMKIWRGWENLITARLLCPIDNVAEFVADPESTRAKLRDGKIKLLDNEGDPKLPAFLYDKDTADGSLAQGLFRGRLLLAVYTHIFISPSAATGGKISLKRGNAQIHGMEKVLPSTICYAAIQAYVALCCSKEWKEEWKGVKFPRLYVLLREQFAHSDDPWCAETLKWWNEKIFDSAPDMDEEPQEAEQDTQGPSTRSRMDTERLERIRAAAAA